MSSSNFKNLYFFSFWSLRQSQIESTVKFTVTEPSYTDTNLIFSIGTPKAFEIDCKNLSVYSSGDY